MLQRLATLRRLYWRLARPTTLGSRTLVTSGGSVLLVRHAYGPGWYLPGGGVHKGETFADAARREVREETSLLVSDLRVFHVYFSRREGKNDYIALFTTSSYEGYPRAEGREIAEATFHPLTALPDDTSPATRRRIAEYLRGPASDAW